MPLKWQCFSRAKCALTLIMMEKVNSATSYGVTQKEDRSAKGKLLLPKMGFVAQGAFNCRGKKVQM